MSLLGCVTCDGGINMYRVEKQLGGINLQNLWKCKVFKACGYSLLGTQ